MEITLQYFDGCPNWRAADEALSIALTNCMVEAQVRHQLIDTPEAALQHGFRGSPTILINGSDPFAEPDAPVGLSCRVYATEDGRAGSPSVQLLREAIEAAKE